MFNRSNNRDSTALLSSDLYDEHSFFARFSKDVKYAMAEVVIESPFITIKRATEFAALCAKLTDRGVLVYILTRIPNHHDITLRNQAFTGIRILRDVGAIVTTHNDLRHRKFAVIDREILWEGSMNMLSHSNSLELMRRSNSSDMCKQLLNFTSVMKDLKWYNRVKT